MQITVAFKKNDGAYEAALIIDGKFTRSSVGKSVGDLFTKLAGPLLVQQHEDGAEIAINVGILSKVEVERIERKAARERETAEANAEAEEVEKLAAARMREQRANQGPLMAAPVEGSLPGVPVAGQ